MTRSLDDPRRVVSFDPDHMDREVDPYGYYVPPPGTSQSTTVATKVDLDTAARIDAVIQTHKLPIKTRSEFLRVAATHLLTDIVDKIKPGGSLASTTKAVQVALRLAQQEKRMEDIQGLMDHIGRAVEGALKRGAVDDARVNLEEMEAVVEDMNEGSVKRRARKALLKAKVKVMEAEGA